MVLEPRNAEIFRILICTSRKLSHFVVEMEPLSQLCVINAGENLCGKLMHAEECLLL